MTPSVLAFHEVSVVYRDELVLERIEACIPPASMCAIVGPNGAGKSTLIKAALGLVPLAAGSVTVLGGTMAQRRGDVGYVPQRESVDWEFPISALEVVLMGSYGRLGLFRRPGRPERVQAMECLDQVGLAAMAGRQISQLSGGQQQRVFLARALMQRAQLYLLDEPFAGVDAVTEAAIMDVLGALRQRGCAIVAVHHDLSTVRERFDHVLLLNKRLIEAGPVATAFTVDALQRTYGGRLGVLPGPPSAPETIPAGHRHG
ncbi:MAG: metal ABC transporter ATP-binding protein [Planctomycetes bacterium]|nr:metal ABC transporter ATP-binding protein [Planctomycetota bacterium]